MEYKIITENDIGGGNFVEVNTQSVNERGFLFFLENLANSTTVRYRTIATNEKGKVLLDRYF